MHKCSVIMSVYNGDKYVGSAIDSILNQTFNNFEFIIIDDGSTDNTLGVIQSYDDKRIRLLQQENQGLTKSLNTAILNSNGKYIARMDADDISHPYRLEREVAFLDENPECVLVGTNAKIIEKNGVELYESDLPLDSEEIRKCLTERNPRKFHGSVFFHGSVLFRKSAALEVGLYDESSRLPAEDMLLWIKLLNLGVLSNLKEHLYYYRLCPEAISSHSKTKMKKVHRILFRYINGELLPHKDQLYLEFLSKEKNSFKKNGVYYFKVGVGYLVGRNDVKSATMNFLKAIYYNPFQLKAWLYLCISLLPGILACKIINGYRRMFRVIRKN